MGTLLRLKLAPRDYAARSRRQHAVRAKTESMTRLSLRELRFGTMVADAELEGLGDVQRPVTRGDCVDGERPCPFVSCAHHLALDVHPRTGSIKSNFPDKELEDLPATCALDIADAGGATLEVVAGIMNITRERVRQLEVAALSNFQTGGATIMPDVFGERAGGEPIPLSGQAGLRDVALDNSQLRVPVNDTDDEEDEVIDAPRQIWDLSRDETPQRLRSAADCVYRAYINDSVARGFATPAEGKFAERLARVEEHLERVNREKTAAASDPDSKRALCHCAHGNEQHADGTGACTYGHDTRFGGCTCTSYRPRLQRGERKALHAKHDAVVDAVLSEPTRLAHQAARAAERTTLMKMPNEEEMAQRKADVLADLTKNQPTNAARIAERLDLSPSQAGIELRILVADGVAISNGKGGRGNAYALKGFDFDTSSAKAKPAPKAKTPPVRRASPKRPIAPPKVSDLSPAPAGSAARFSLRVQGMQIDCHGADDVLTLVRAIAGRG